MRQADADRQYFREERERFKENLGDQNDTIAQLGKEIEDFKMQMLLLKRQHEIDLRT